MTAWGPTHAALAVAAIITSLVALASVGGIGDGSVVISTAVALSLGLAFVFGLVDPNKPIC